LTTFLGRRAVSGRLVAVFFCAVSAGVPLVLSATTFPAAGAGCILLGMGIGALFPIFLGLAMDRRPDEAAGYSMIMVVALTIGGQVSSLVVGFLAQAYGLTAAYGVLVPAAVLLIVSYTLFYRANAGARVRTA
jgi:fucose permease